MKTALGSLLAWLCLTLSGGASAQTVVDIPTRPDVTQRVLAIPAANPAATVILLAGGHGGLGIFPNGSLRWGEGNFLIRSRQLFVEQGLNVVIVDAPSDRQNTPYLAGFRQTAEHAADIGTVIAWVRAQGKAPVWLVGTSRGTQSAAFLATRLPGREGPDGLVLTATILKDNKGRAVPAMPLEQLTLPVLLVHHEQDGCSHCAYADLPELQEKLRHLPRTALLSFRGGADRGDPCEAYAHHGFNGLEKEVVTQIADWIRATQK
ncbi:alpha/beta hydrolase [uncultured Dechloromonas sp.]|uniref:alpha/beta hydrolase n=1 Tax=uncultured Dechloromonas sp. TaxID=171719 RepID=UPI0025CE7F37|nr:alpha/beta hydrolase [uncultured Dechloromonas sp.]